MVRRDWGFILECVQHNATGYEHAFSPRTPVLHVPLADFDCPSLDGALQGLV